MTRLECILEYKKNNPGCDPNLYELVELTDELIKTRDGNIDKYANVFGSNIRALWDNDLGVHENCPLLMLMMNVKRNYINNSVSPCYYAKLAGVSLYIRQQQRAVRRCEQEKVIFDNKAEFEFLRKELSIARKKLLLLGITDINEMPEFKLYDMIYDIYTECVSTKESKYEEEIMKNEEDMKFSKKLCNISVNESLCYSTWNQIKPYLIKIAKDRNAKGCHVRFVGFGPSFSQQMNELISSEGLCRCAFVGGLLYWDPIGDRKSPFVPFPCVSDKWLEVILTSSETVSVIERPLSSEVYNQFLCHYIS